MSKGETPRERMERGIRTVTREGQKATLIESTVEAVAVLLLVNLFIAVVPIAQLPETVPVPGAPTPALATLNTGAVVAAIAGVSVFAVALRLRLRRPTVERFGEVNPELAEALRTARDAVEADAEGRMAARLYDDTVERLGEASSLGLLDLRRLGVVLLVVAVAAPASLGATAAGFEVAVEQSSGDAIEGILDAAGAFDADLLSLAGRRKSPTGKALFGSVAQRVALRSDRPVLFCSAASD